MKTVMLFVFLLLVAACTRVAEKPVPVAVKVPVMLPCLDQIPSEPVYEIAYITREDSLCAMTDALLIERRQRMIYIEQLTALLKGCVLPEKGAQDRAPGQVNQSVLDSHGKAYPRAPPGRAQTVPADRLR